MLNRHIKYSVISAVAFLAAACSDDSKPDFYNGTGLLNVTIEVVSPKAVTVTPPAADDFCLEMVAENDGNVQSSHKWDTFSSFRQGERYLSGNYRFTATHGDSKAEGFDKPFFKAVTSYHISDGATATVDLRATLSNVPVSFTSTPSFNSAHDGWTAMIHSAGGSYIEFSSNETRTAFMRPEPLTVSIGLDSGKAIFVLARDISTCEGELMAFTIDAEGDDVILECNGDEVQRVTITQQMITSPGPEVTIASDDAYSYGNISLLERTLPYHPVMFTIESPTAPAEVLLTLDSPLLNTVGAPSQINLVDSDDSGHRFLESIGVIIPSFSAGTTNFDISPLLSHLQYRAGVDNISRISLTVTEPSGRQSAPATITINTIPFDINVISASDAVIGINTVDIVVAAPSASLSEEMSLIAREADGTLSNAKIENITPLGNATYRVTVSIPAGTKPLTLLAYYGTELKAELSIGRISPDYTIDADVFATRVKLRINCPSRSELVAVITRRLVTTVNGNPVTVLSRDENQGLITIIGLEPQKAYTFVSTLQPDVDTAAHDISIVTEAATPLPNGDFEDTKKAIDMADIACGGRYSQTFAEIFNCQNKASYRHDAPTGWANTNIKTFNTGSRLKNTWYMQPSVFTIEDRMSGDYAVELVSVAFDPNGAPIADYLQESYPYVRYSRNIPDIAWRAAAKIFLGTYSFSPFPEPAETYIEGVGIESRPTSLNGFYIYEPTAADPSDRGLITIEVLGMENDSEIILAAGSVQLEPSTGYTAFSIPLTYSRFGIKATRVKVMASSSRFTGNLHAETANIITLPDPVRGASTGSRLRLDNLTFAY